MVRVQEVDSIQSRDFASLPPSTCFDCDTPPARLRLMESRTPASVLIQPSRPTTATTSSPPPSSSFRFLSPLTTATAPTSPAYTPPLDPPSPPGPIPNLLPLFAKYPVNRSLRGTVRIRVEHTTFFCHREVLILASPFFEACITGGWKESQPRNRKRRSVRKSLEIPVPEEWGSDLASPSSKRESFQTSKSHASADSPTSVDEGPHEAEEVQSTDAESETPVPARPPTPTVHSPQGSEAGDPAPSLTASYISSVVEDDDEEDTEGEEDVICRLSLPEESATHFQSLLRFIYPRCDPVSALHEIPEFTTNVHQQVRMPHFLEQRCRTVRLRDLNRWKATLTPSRTLSSCRMASKFDIPSLRNACIAFLLPSAAGKPLAGMKIAEEMGIPELYKEASRYALDNYANWQPEDLATLSQTTLLKLERRFVPPHPSLPTSLQAPADARLASPLGRRSWFLERLLKLGLVQTSRDYVCQPTCPDQALCARLVDEKWRSAWSSAFRFGTPQPCAPSLFPRSWA